jgi:hypothetical protein
MEFVEAADAECISRANIFSKSSFREMIASERCSKYKSCDILKKVGNHLNLKHDSVVVAQKMLNYYYMNHSSGKFDVDSIAMACFLIATKTTDNPFTIRDVLTAFYEITKHDIDIKSIEGKEVFGVGSGLYMKWKNSLIPNEMHVLKELGFYTFAFLSSGSCSNHSDLCNSINEMLLSKFKNNDDNDNDGDVDGANYEHEFDHLMKDAIMHAECSHYTDSYLRYSIDSIATACVLLAVKCSSSSSSSSSSTLHTNGSYKTIKSSCTSTFNTDVNSIEVAILEVIEFRATIIGKGEGMRKGGDGAKGEEKKDSFN